MATSKMTWAMTLLVALVGSSAGGPQELRQADYAALVGSDPAPAACNGNGTNTPSCKGRGVPNTPTTTGYACDSGTFGKINAELPGAAYGTRYDNDQLVCTTDTVKRPKCEAYTLKVTGTVNGTPACTAANKTPGGE